MVLSPAFKKKKENKEEELAAAISGSPMKMT